MKSAKIILKRRSLLISLACILLGLMNVVCGQEISYKRLRLLLWAHFVHTISTVCIQ